MVGCAKWWGPMVQHGWMSIHSLFLCVMVMFYCVWTPQGVADDANVDSLMRALKASSDVLSAMGEYWPEATRSRDILDRVSTATIRRFFTKSKEKHHSATNIDPQSSSDPVHDRNMGLSSDWTGISQAPEPLAPRVLDDREGTNDPFLTSYGAHDDAFVPADVFHSFLGNGMDIETGDGAVGEQNHDDFDEIMYGLFGDSTGGEQAA